MSDSTITFRVSLDESYRQQQFLENGELPPTEIDIAFPISDLPRTVREAIVHYLNVHGKHFGSAPEIDLRYHKRWENIPTVEQLADYLNELAIQAETRRLEEMQRNIAALTQALQDAVAKREKLSSYSTARFLSRHDIETASECCPDALKAYKAALKAYQDALPSIEAEIQARKEAEEQERAAREEERIRARAAWEAEKKRWIQAHGSEHLKAAYSDGYDCTRRYLIERAAQEYPGFTPDINDTAAWRERSCPSAEALAVASEVQEKHNGVEATVVWLTAPPSYSTKDEEADPYYTFEPTEAVVVQDPHFMFKSVWLVRPM